MDFRFSGEVLYAALQRHVLLWEIFFFASGVG